MRPRPLARRLALQYLFMYDLAPEGIGDPGAFLAEHCDRPDAEPYARQLIRIVLDRRDEIDRLLSASAENWALNRIAAVERNVLRLGGAELLSGEIPAPVVLDEAVRLAKQFGGKDSGTFVNGVLDRVRLSLRERGDRS